MVTNFDGQLLDIRGEKCGVEIEIRKDATALWVHVNGVTVLRIQGMSPGGVFINGDVYITES